MASYQGTDWQVFAVGNANGQDSLIPVETQDGKKVADHVASRIQAAHQRGEDRRSGKHEARALAQKKEKAQKKEEKARRLFESLMEGE